METERERESTNKQRNTVGFHRGLIVIVLRAQSATSCVVMTVGTISRS